MNKDCERETDERKNL